MIKRAALVAVVFFASAPSVAGWKIDSFKDRMTDKTVKVATLPAQAADHGIQARLEIRCLVSKLVGGLILSLETTASFSPGRMGLVYRIDNSEPKARFTTVNSSGTGMSLWGEPEELLGGKKMQVEIQPARSTNLFYEFDLSGVDKAVASIPCLKTRM
jgi:hypothetical protein